MPIHPPNRKTSKKRPKSELSEKETRRISCRSSPAASATTQTPSRGPFTLHIPVSDRASIMDCPHLGTGARITSDWLADQLLQLRSPPPAPADDIEVTGSVHPAIKAATSSSSAKPSSDYVQQWRCSGKKSRKCFQMMSVLNRGSV